MNTATHPSWMLLARELIGLLGAEYDLMRDTSVLKRFYTAALLIVSILLLSAVSIYYALELLFHTLAVEIILAVFFCLLFTCIYIFLLNTFAKENRVQRRIFNSSNTIRIGFVVFMGVLIAQPLVILLYTDRLSPAVEAYKQKIWNTHRNKIDALTESEIVTLVNKQQFYTQQKKQFNTYAYDNELINIANKIDEIKSKAATATQSARQVIENNSFFLFRIAEVNHEYRLSWLLTFLLVLLFLLPGYLIYSISSKHEYYQMKKAQEKTMIKAAYTLFTSKYQALFNGQVTVFSRFEDAPFNTVRKQPPVPNSTTDFLIKYAGKDK